MNSRLSWQSFKKMFGHDRASPIKRKNLEKHSVQSVQFIGEQYGRPEGELKNRVVEIFEQEVAVKSGYLARVRYDNESNAVVALCLRTMDGPDKQLAEKIGNVFSAMFGRQQHLDIVFLNEDQENEVQEICTPFFRRR